MTTTIKKENTLPKYAKFIIECREKNCMRQRYLGNQLINSVRNKINRGM